jgi:hypothetical protein
MPFVNTSDDDDAERLVAAGAPPVDWDPNDPDAVKVHYDLRAWDFDQRAELAGALADASLPHAWEGDELVVPEAAETAVDALFEELEAQLGPFPVLLDDEEPATEFGLDEWPPTDLDTLRAALIDAEIPHRWEGTTVFVAADAEHEVDDLLDAIERGDIASFTDEGAGPPEGALSDLFTVADRLAREPDDSGARERLVELVPALHERQPPFGVAVRSWFAIVTAARALTDVLADDADPSDVIGGAQELRSVTRPFV